MIRIHRNPTSRQLRQFGWALLAFSTLAAVLLHHRGWGATTALLVWGAGSLSALLGFAFSTWMRLLYLGLSFAAFPIGWVVSHVLLFFVYYLVLTPIGLALRIAGRDSLQRRWERNATTYWRPLRQNEDPARYFRQF